MAYKRLSGVSLNNPKETFQHIRDFLCQLNGIADYSTAGVGWTLHDAVYAVSSSNISINDYFVIASTGEDGNRQLFFRFIYVNGYITVYGYLNWNNTTHTGTHLYGTSSSWTNTDATNNVLFIYSDLDAFVCIARYSSSYNAQLGGWCPESRRSTTVTTIGAAISSGSNVVVTFASVPTGWDVGDRVFMYDNANIERVQINNISGNDVTFATIASSYASGAKFIMEDTYYCTAANGSHYYRRIGNSGTKNEVSYPWLNSGPAVTSGDPLDNIPYPAVSMFLYSTTSFYGPIKNAFIAQASAFTGESSHTVEGVAHKYFLLAPGVNVLLKDV